MISTIVAVDKNYAIGNKGGLVVKNPIDMAFFSGFTQGKVLICGHNTYQTLPKLSGDRCVVPYIKGNNHYIREILDISGKMGKDVVVIGGAKTYKEFAHLLDELLITFNDTEAEEADSCFPVVLYTHLTNRELIFKGKHGSMEFRIERWTK